MDESKWSKLAVVFKECDWVLKILINIQMLTAIDVAY
jgi:hypothetical protein